MSASKAVCGWQKPESISFHLIFVQCFAAGTGSGSAFPAGLILIWSLRIHADPDPQHWILGTRTYIVQKWDLMILRGNVAAFNGMETS